MTCGEKKGSDPSRLPLSNGQNMVTSGGSSWALLERDLFITTVPAPPDTKEHMQNGGGYPWDVASTDIRTALHEWFRKLGSVSS